MIIVNEELIFWHKPGSFRISGGALLRRVELSNLLLQIIPALPNYHGDN